MKSSKEYMINYYKEHREEIIERAKKYNKEHREEIRIYDKNHYKEYGERIRERRKHYYTYNKQMCLLTNKLWRIKNPDKQKLYIENWRIKNPNHKVMEKCYSPVLRAIKKGIIKKETQCYFCDKYSSNLHAHHPDYSKPLEVIQTCHSCHQLIHRYSNCPFLKEFIPKKMGAT